MVSLSGGLDSVCLLHACILLKRSSLPNLNLACVHINHGLSENAKQWLDFCKSLCDRYELDFYSASLNLAIAKGESLEATAREARYKKINDLLSYKFEGKSILLLGHHQNDQAETFLLQMARGAGTKGLSCMPKTFEPSSSLAYVRPFLSFSKAELEQFANLHSLEWIEDESNADQEFDRNFIRHSIVPKLQLKWPNISKTISRSAELCANSQIVIDEYMALLKTSLLTNDYTINVSKLRDYSLQTQASFIRYCLQLLSCSMPSSVQITTVLNMIEKQAKRASYIETLDYFIEYYQEYLFLLPKKWFEQIEALDVKLERSSFAGFNLDLQCSYDEQQHICDIDLPSSGTKIDFACSSLKVKFFNNRPTKTLKSWYQEFDVSPLNRKKTPVFLHENKVLAVLINTPLQTRLLKSEYLRSFQDSELRMWQLCRNK